MTNINTNTPTEAELKAGQIVETQKSPQENNIDEKSPRIKKGRVDYFTIYEISESELENIEKGNPSSTLLNLSITLITTGTSFLVTLFTVDLTNKLNLYVIFTIITIVGYIGGCILGILWWRTKTDLDKTIEKIKKRVVE